MKKYVIHTHSVYANILCCAQNGEKLAKEIFANADYSFVWLPSIKPGFTLTIEMNKALKKNPSAVIFMQNHGLVVHDDDISRVKELQLDVNNRIMEYFKIPEDAIGQVKLEKLEENKFVSKSPFILEYLKQNSVSLEFLDDFPLYPDQLVYLNNCLRFDQEKLQVKCGKLEYKTNEKEAQTLEEILIAYLFVIYWLKKLNLPISIMAAPEVDFINNWEAEKYRRSVK